MCISVLQQLTINGIIKHSKLPLKLSLESKSPTSLQFESMITPQFRRLKRSMKCLLLHKTKLISSILSENCNIFVIKQYQYIKLVMKTVTWSLKIIPSISREFAEEKLGKKHLCHFHHFDKGLCYKQIDKSQNQFFCFSSAKNSSKVVN